MGPEHPAPWYASVTRYQWLVLVIASLGWVFDVFEGQIFVANMNEAMPALLPLETSRIPRSTTASPSPPSSWAGPRAGSSSATQRPHRSHAHDGLHHPRLLCVHGPVALSQTWWQLTLCRFLVALGTGGEWAVATAQIAEVFPQQARARSLAIFHGSSVLGTVLGAMTGLALAGQQEGGWRWAFVIGAAPALLVVWVRLSLREPERSSTARLSAPLTDLFRGRLLSHTLLGVALATVGLATFWGRHLRQGCAAPRSGGGGRRRPAVSAGRWPACS
jgi:MFS family permease